MIITELFTVAPKFLRLQKPTLYYFLSFLLNTSIWANNVQCRMYKLYIMYNAIHKIPETNKISKKDV